MKRYEPMLQLRSKRIEKGMTQQELANAVGITRAVICNYENGLWSPRRNTIEKIALVLDCPVGELYGGVKNESIKLTAQKEIFTDLISDDLFNYTKIFDLAISINDLKMKKTLVGYLENIGESLISKVKEWANNL